MWALYYNLEDKLYLLEKKEEDPSGGFMPALPIVLVPSEGLS